MIKRHLEKAIKRYSKEYPVIGIVGPRQSGKTTLSKYLFKDHAYVSLESPDKRLLAASDPRSFLSGFSDKIIIDEIQRVPDLFSYIQEFVDEDPTPGRFIITGSQQFLLMEGIGQSLAGRIAIFNLMPFGYRELVGKSPSEYPGINIHRKNKSNNKYSFASLAISGFYPRIHDRKIDPVKWYEEYINNYIEKDVRQLSQIADLTQFHLFLKMVAGRTGQILNYASLSNDIGVSQPTVKRWMSILETSGIIVILQPYFKNFGKRLIKSPKIYFIDTGILCSLLSITDESSLMIHPVYGSIFENFVIGEFYKSFLHSGKKPPIYYWRDKTGNEIDCLIEKESELLPFEIKSSGTFNSSFKDGLMKWFRFKGNNTYQGIIIYNGDTLSLKSDIKIVSWLDIL